MKDLFFIVLTLVGLFVVLPILILRLRDRLFHRPPSPKQTEENNQRFRERLAHPDFDAFERHFGCPMPEPLKRLYSDPAWRDRTDFEVVPPTETQAGKTWYVAYFAPLDAENLENGFHDTARYFAFADDGGGNAYVIDPRMPDPPVLYHDHEETGDDWPVASSVTEFLRWERIFNQYHRAASRMTERH